MKQPSIIVRQETRADQETILEINNLAFRCDNEARLINRLRASATFIPELSLVADHEYKTAGHILFTKIRINGIIPGSDLLGLISGGSKLRIMSQPNNSMALQLLPVL